MVDVATAGKTRQRRRRGRRWLLGGLVFLGLVLTAAAFTPALLSTRTGNRLLLDAINKRIPGNVTAASVEVGWFSGTHVRGLVLRDPEGREVLNIPRVDSDLTLLGVLESPLPLGSTSAEVQGLRIVSYHDGTTSLSRAIRGPTPKEEGRGGRGFRGDIRVSARAIEWRGPDKPGVQLRNGQGRIRIDQESLVADIASRVAVPGFPETRVQASVEGSLDSDSGVFVATKRSSLREGERNDSSGTYVEIEKGSRLALGDKGTSEATISLRYDLRRLSALLGPVLPDWLQMSGRDTIKVKLEGRLADAPGLLKLRDLRIAPTSFGYDRIQLKELVLTKGRIPLELRDGILSFGGAELAANGGTLKLAGYIDLRGREPVYVVEKPATVVQGFKLDARLANGPLKFLPVSWGHPAPGEVDGNVTAKLEQATLPLGKGGLARAQVKGELMVTNLNAKSPAITAIAESLGPVKALGNLAAPEVKEQDMNMPFALEDGDVRFSGVELDAGPLDLSFSGTVGVDGRLRADSTVRAGGFATPARVAIGGDVRDPDVKLRAGLGPPEAKELLEQAPSLLEKVFDRDKK